MRILLVSEVFRPAMSGVTVVTARLAKALSARGHQVAVLTARIQPDAPSVTEEDGYQVYRISGVANPFRPGLRLTVAAKSQVQKIITEFQPDVIHIQDIISLSTQAARLGKKAGIPVLATHHFLLEYALGYIPNFPGLRVLAGRWLERRLTSIYGFCSLLIVPTETVKKALKPLNLPVPIEVVSNGVELRPFAESKTTFRAEHSIGEHVKVVLAVGRLDPEKNVGVVLEALKILNRQDILAVVIGSGLQATMLQNQFATAKWIPRLETTELIGAYQAADLLCAPCPIETESMSTLEAMAAGLPIVAANQGALVELVEENKNGYLVAPDKPQEWANAIQKLVDNPDQRTAFGQQSLQKVQGRSFDQSISQIEKIYQRLTN